MSLMNMSSLDNFHTCPDKREDKNKKRMESLSIILILPFYHHKSMINHLEAHQTVKSGLDVNQWSKD